MAEAGLFEFSMPLSDAAANLRTEFLQWEELTRGGLDKRVVIFQCPDCERYLQQQAEPPTRTWIKAELESKELLSFCVKSLKCLNQVSLARADFTCIIPDPSMIGVTLILEKVFPYGAVLQHTHTVDFPVQHQMCESCSTPVKHDQLSESCSSSRKARGDLEQKLNSIYLQQELLYTCMNNI